jgi:primary-amine oxidase
MLSVRTSTCLLLALGLTVLVVAGDETEPKEPPAKVKPKAGQPTPAHPPSDEIVQEFPSNGEMETAWKVRWGTTRGYGVFIKDAFFKPGPNERWMQVLGDARLSEIFVPYHSGSPRYWDVSYNFDLCTMTREDAGPFGKLLRAHPGEPPTVVQEVRDRGLIWRGRVASGEERARRGQELVVWGCLLAANYRYVMEYAFRDDGGITFRMGSTGHNLSGAATEGHMHLGLWRVQVNLDGPKNNSVYLVEHVEPRSDLADDKSRAKTVVTPFNGGKEGWADWNAEKFTMVRIVNDKRKNRRGDALTYDLMPMRAGNARHYGGDREVCTQHDFWVTRAREGTLKYPEVDQYAAKRESIMKTDVVVWHGAALHHDPRAEDGKVMKDGPRQGEFVGVTHIMWSGFTMLPRNLFDHTPLFPYNTKR